MNFVKIDVNSLNSYQPLMVISPTGSGKTSSIIKYALKQNVYSRVVFALPTKAAIREIFNKIKMYTEDVGRDDSDARLEENFNSSEVWKRRIVVTSYERLLSELISDQDNFMNNLIVIDEAHLLLSEGRNCTLQEILAYYTYLKEKMRINVVLLSATMPEVDELSQYLGAKVICMKERPVDLEIRRIRLKKQGRENYYLSKAHAFIDYVKEGNLDLNKYKQILVYTNTRKSAEEISLLLEKYLGFPSTYHHAGLPLERRKEIENDMRSENNKYKIIVSTDTLAVSINTNVDVVVMLALKRFAGTKTFVEPSTISQVIGRAGRPGYSEKGLAIIFEENDEAKVVDKALKKDYGRVDEPIDYAQTVLRWIYTRKDPYLLSKYGFRYSQGKVKDAMVFLENIGAIENHEVTLIGKIFATEMVSKIGMNLLKIIMKFDKKMEKENPLSRSILYSFSYSFIVDGYYNKRVNLEILREGSPIILSYLGRIKGKLNDYSFQRIGIKVEPEEWFYYALTTPQKIFTDDIAESLRKSSEIISRLAENSLIDRKLVEPSNFIMRLMRSYRRLIRNKGDVNEFLYFALSNYKKLSNDEFLDRIWISSKGI